MRIAVVVASEAFLESAGVRIRYRRFEKAFAGAQWSFVTLDALSAARSYPADAYVFVKTFAASALILMAHLSRLGKTVAQDLFDDYFSQIDDARLARFRLWLAQSAAFTDAAICTTPRMRTVVEAYLPERPVTVVDDPIDFPHHDDLRVQLDAKLVRMRETRRLRVLWFGIGDNPYFPVGLQDLLAQADALVRLDRAGWAVDLEVLTNDRALDAVMLARLRHFPLPVRLRPWSVEAESDAIRDADIAFLPVAGQSFSIAKSLNRAASAIASGCQVLSPAFPLYERLGALTYAQADDLATDLARGELRVNARSIGQFADALRSLTDGRALAETFVNGVGTGGPAGTHRGELAVIHGAGAGAREHKLAVRLGALSVSTPFQAHRLNYDIRYEIEGDQLIAMIHQPLAERIDSVMPSDTPVRIVDREFVPVRFAPDCTAPSLPLRAAISGNPSARAIAYPTIMRTIIRHLESLMSDVAIIVSDADPLMQAAQASQRLSVQSAPNMLWPDSPALGQ